MNAQLCRQRGQPSDPASFIELSAFWNIFTAFQYIRRKVRFYVRKLVATRSIPTTYAFSTSLDPYEIGIPVLTHVMLGNSSFLVYKTCQLYCPSSKDGL